MNKKALKKRLAEQQRINRELGMANTRLQGEVRKAHHDIVVLKYGEEAANGIMVSVSSEEATNMPFSFWVDHEAG